MTGTSIPAGARIGHVHLKIADLERAIGFYRDYLGFDLLFNLGSAKIWPPPSNACSIMAGRSTGRPITAPTRPSTCTTRISTGSSWPGTGTPASGRAGTEQS